MEPAKRTELTQGLAALVAEMAAAIRPRMVERGGVRERALKLHADEHVGEDFEVWTDLLARRAAVLWVLKSVYVRVLEDRGLLRLSSQAFRWARSMAAWHMSAVASGSVIQRGTA